MLNCTLVQFEHNQNEMIFLKTAYIGGHSMLHATLLIGGYVAGVACNDAFGNGRDAQPERTLGRDGASCLFFGWKLLIGRILCKIMCRKCFPILVDENCRFKKSSFFPTLIMIHIMLKYSVCKVKTRFLFSSALV